jgi:hypothetical protein
MPGLLDPLRAVVRPVRFWLRTATGLQPELDRVRADLAAATAREAELRRMVEGAQEQHRRAAEQHRQAVEQHRQAAEQLARLSAEPDPTHGPSIFIATLPKSGSIYLLNVLGLGLGYLSYNVGLGYFPRDLLDWSRLRTSSRGGAVTQSHVDASAANLQVLRLYQPRVQVHLRDPRQATLSMTHHLRRFWELYRDLGVMQAVEPAPTAEFFARTLGEQIDWMIDHYLTGCVRWIGEWLDVADAGGRGLDVLLTTFEEMTRDEAGFIDRTLGFFGIAPGRFSRPAVEKSMAVHFRQGTADEWRGVFTAAQQDRATAMIPAAWKDRFGWPK